MAKKQNVKKVVVVPTPRFQPNIAMPASDILLLADAHGVLWRVDIQSGRMRLVAVEK